MLNKACGNCKYLESDYCVYQKEENKLYPDCTACMFSELDEESSKDKTLFNITCELCRSYKGTECHFTEMEDITTICSKCYKHALCKTTEIGIPTCDNCDHKGNEIYCQLCSGKTSNTSCLFDCSTMPLKSDNLGIVDLEDGDDEEEL